MKYCEICGGTKNAFFNQQFQKVLCSKHAIQLKRHGKILNLTRFDNNQIIINDEYAEIILLNRHYEIIGKAKIDLQHVNIIMPYKWIYCNGYAVATINHKRIRLHRYLLNAQPHEFVDHHNRDRLDCRLFNIRICTRIENNRHKSVKRDSKSQIRGVYKDNYNKYCAYIGVNYKKIYLGYYNNLNDGIQARRDAEELYFGEFSPLKGDLYHENENISGF
jgi:hypothetical protein